MTTFISTTETAKLIRKALKAAFPGQKFSVRKSTGTASAWIGIGWEDGPETREVMAVADRFRGERFDGMTDSYEQLNTPYVCSGINYNRHVTNAPKPQFTDPDAPGYVY